MPQRGKEATIEEFRQRQGFDREASAGLFVGVSDFEDKAFDPLYAVDDAVDLAYLFAMELELLLPQSCVLALAGDPKKAKTQGYLEELLRLGARRTGARQTDFYRELSLATRASGREGLLLLTVASHGQSDQEGDFLVARDSISARLLRTGVAVEELLDEVASARAYRRLVLLDACRERRQHGTRGIRSGGLEETFAEVIARASGQAVLSGSTQGGYAYDDLSKRNGVFTAAILDGLRGAAPATEDGLITVRTLADYVQERVAAWIHLHQPSHASKTLGIGRRIEGAIEGLPLAIKTEVVAALEVYRQRRMEAVARLRENFGEVLSGTLIDEIVGQVPPDRPADPLEVDGLMEEIEALDGSERSQRGLRDFVRERYGIRASGTAVPDRVPVQRAVSSEERKAALEKSQVGRTWRRVLEASVALLLVVLGLWSVGWSEGDREPEEAVGGPVAEEPGEELAETKLAGMEEESAAQVPGSANEEMEVAKSPSTEASSQPKAPPPSEGTKQASEPPPQSPKEAVAKPAAGQAAHTDRTEEKRSSSKQDYSKYPPVGNHPAGTAWNGPLGIRFRFVPAGTNPVGSPKDEPGRFDREWPRHEVKLTRGFWLAETELTQEDWTKLDLPNPSSFKGCGKSCPVENVSWFEALSFANLLSEKEGLGPCYELDCEGTMGTAGYSCKSARFKGLDCPGYRLPTGAEWEVAARAGTTTAIYTGPLRLKGQRNGPELQDIAWYGGNSGVGYKGGYECSDWKEKQFPSERCGTHPVGQKVENQWGLRDMLGNVWEWTGTYWGGSPSGLMVDPEGPQDGAKRVIRGGSWYDRARDVRAAYRDSYEPGFRLDSLGFRLSRGPNRSGEKAEPTGR